MSKLIILFINNLLPVFLIAGGGYLLARIFHLDHRPLSQVILYLTSPCLIFTLLTKSQLENSQVLLMMTLAGASIILVGGLAWVVGKTARLERATLAAVLLASMFMNAGNYGLPVALFAFGENVLSYATLYFVTNVILTYTLGVVVASMGKSSLRQAVSNLVRLPTLYALLLGLLFMQTHWQVPIPIERASSLLGNATIPLMLVMAGMQFTKLSWTGKSLPIVIAGGVRLLAHPALVLFLCAAFGITGASRQAGVIQSAMPTAVLTTVVATEYQAEPTLVTATVFITTLLSPLTITPLLAFLGA